MTSLLATQSVNLASAMPVLAQINPIFINLLVGGFLLISIVMVLIVLIQRPQGGGLGGAFGAGGGGGGGGGGAGQTAFGTKTGDVLTGGTIAIFVLFIIFAIILNFVTRPVQATASQPVLNTPVNETTPEDGDLSAEDVEEAVDDAVNQADDMIEDGAEAVDDMVDDVVDDAVDNAESLIDPVVDPAEDE